MKKKISAGVAVLAIVALAAFNLNLNNDQKNISSLTLAYVEALANNENATGWTELRDDTKSYSNGVLYKQSTIITCHKGGPSSACTPSCMYQVKNDNGTWTSWMPC